MSAIKQSMSNSTTLSKNVISYLMKVEATVTKKSGVSPVNRRKSVARKGSLPPIDNKKSLVVTLVERLLSMGELADNTLIYAVALMRRCLTSSRTMSISSISDLFSAIMFLSQKIVLDGEVWFLEEFSIITGISKTRLSFYEGLILNNLEFRVHVDLKELTSTAKFLITSF